jgi:hypothetical protein
MLFVDDVHDAALGPRRRREIKDVDEEPVLTDCFRATAPSDELELGDLAIGLEIVISSCVACSEGETLYLLPVGKDVGQRNKDANHVDDNVDLCGEALHDERAVEDFLVDALRDEVLRQSGHGLSTELRLEAGDPLSQVRTDAERLDRAERCVEVERIRWRHEATSSSDTSARVVRRIRAADTGRTRRVVRSAALDANRQMSACAKREALSVAWRSAVQRRGDGIIGARRAWTVSTISALSMTRR